MDLHKQTKRPAPTLPFTHISTEVGQFVGCTVSSDGPTCLTHGREQAMSNSNIAWMSSAAYLYVLHLDEPQLAWEYLRRNSIYRQDWLRSRADPLTFPASIWGLQFRREPRP